MVCKLQQLTQFAPKMSSSIHINEYLVKQNVGFFTESSTAVATKLK